MFEPLKCKQYLGLDVRKPDIGVCKQQRHIPAYASAQSDHRFSCSPSATEDMRTCHMQNYKCVASLSG